jgi:Domain of unknown function (DUF4136)
MTKRIVLLVALCLAAAPAFAQKVVIDFDPEYDFSKIETFAWGKSEETSLKDTSPLWHSRIINLIEHRLSEGGIPEVEPDENPSVFVTYHVNEKDEMRLNTTHYGYGYGGWYSPYYGGSMATSSTTAYTYTRGTLLIDMWDAETHELVWRGSSEQIMKEKPEKVEKQLSKALDKIGKQWNKMYTKHLKEMEKAALEAEEG